MSSGTSNKFKIYTRTGDEGFTSLYSGGRRSKDDLVFESMGTNDELSCNIGVAISQCPPVLQNLAERLKTIQCNLQDINSNLATPKSSSSGFLADKVAFDKEGRLVEELENWIDEMEEYLPKLRNFILPSGGFPSSTLHVCRSVCRRAERSLVQIVKNEECDSSTLKYLNRDFLFVAARYSCNQMGFQEDIYKK